MALKKTVEKSVEGFQEKLVAQDAYWRVDKIEGNKTLMSATINAYASAGSTVIIDSFSVGFVVDVDGDNFIEQAYEQAKKMPQFADAQDC